MSDLEDFSVGTLVEFIYPRWSKGDGSRIKRGATGVVTSLIDSDKPRAQVYWDDPSLNQKFPTTNWPQDWLRPREIAFALYEKLRAEDP